MANEKKPSIYVDRGTIGSVDELDEYGVWVKSEPQDLSSLNSKTKESAQVSVMDDLDLAIPEMEDIPYDLGDDASQNTLDDDFDLPDIEEAAEDTVESFETGGEDFSGGDFTEQMDGLEPDEASGALDFSDFSGGDFDTAEDENTAESDDEESGEFSGFFAETSDEASTDDFIETSDTQPEKNAENSVSGNADAGEKTGAKVETPDLSTELLMKIAEELSSIRGELSTLKKEFLGIKAAASPAEAGENGFFDEEDDEKIALTGDELNNILNTADFTEEAGADATITMQDELGEEAPGELLAEDSGDDISIDFSETISDDFASPELTDPFADKEDSAQKDAPKDEDDETISIMDLDINLDETNLEELSGETKLDETSDTDQSLDPQSFDISLDEEIVLTPDEPGEPSLDAEIAQVEEELEDLSFDEEIILADEEPDLLPLDDAGESLPDFADEENEELRQLRENGAEPMTSAPAPEDAEYLEEDPLNQEPLQNEQEEELLNESSFDDTLDLSEAVIDEPDLSSEIHDNPLEEPSLEDISISLDPDDNAFDENIVNEDEANIELAETAEEEIEILLDETKEPENDGLSAESGFLESEPFDEDGIFENAASVFPEDEITSKNDEDGGDPSLIPEGFVVEEDDSQTPLEELEEADEKIISGEALDILEDESDDAVPKSEELKTDESTAKTSNKNKDPVEIPSQLKQELKTVLSYMDQLLESLPDNKIEEFAKSDYYDTYKKVFKELGLV